MNDDNLQYILTRYKIVAIVGLSRDPSKDSYKVTKYLKDHSFHIVPINPTPDEILGEKSYKNLTDMPVDIQKTIEIADIFRPSNEVLPIVEQAVQLKKSFGVPYVVWMQVGIINEQAAKKAREAGLTVIMDKCTMQEHKRLVVGNVQTST